MFTNNYNSSNDISFKKYNLNLQIYKHEPNAYKFKDIFKGIQMCYVILSDIHYLSSSSGRWVVVVDRC